MTISEWIQAGILIVAVGGVIYNKIRTDARIETNQENIKARLDKVDRPDLVVHGDCERETGKLTNTIESIHLTFNEVFTKITKIEDEMRDLRHEMETRDNERTVRLTSIQADLGHLKTCIDRHSSILDELPKLKETVADLNATSKQLDKALARILDRMG